MSTVVQFEYWPNLTQIPFVDVFNVGVGRGYRVWQLESSRTSQSHLVFLSVLGGSVARYCRILVLKSPPPTKSPVTILSMFFVMMEGIAFDSSNHCPKPNPGFLDGFRGDVSRLFVLHTGSPPTPTPPPYPFFVVVVVLQGAGCIWQLESSPVPRPSFCDRLWWRRWMKVS